MPNDSATETTDLVEILQDHGLSVEEIGQAADDGIIVNVSREGKYLYTLTISRTPGY